MSFENERVNAYAEKHTSGESALLQQIWRETKTEVHMSRMLSGHLQGRFLSMICKLIRPQTVLEIGTYTGYSALCLAEGLPATGKIITIDINDELEARARNYFKASGKNEQIDYRVGDARTLIPELPGSFDLVWLDADKESYSQYFDLVIDRVPSGGLILADNVLWSGKVLEPNRDKDTMAIAAFNKKVAEDPRVETMLLPLRDGIMMMLRV